MLLEMLGCYLDSDWAQAAVYRQYRSRSRRQWRPVSPVAHLSLAPVPGLVSVSQSMFRPREVQGRAWLYGGINSRHNIGAMLLLTPLLVMHAVLHNIGCVVMLHNRDGGQNYAL